MMSLRKSDEFIADIEQQFQWYALNADWEIAESYLEAVEATVQLLERYPQLGPIGGFRHPRLRTLRFLVVFRPFNKHILFYEIVNGDVIMRRAMHGQRNLPQRLLES